MSRLNRPGVASMVSALTAGTLLMLGAPLVRAQAGTTTGSKAAQTPAPQSQTAAPAIIKSITRTALPHGDRITIEFSRDVTYAGDRVSNPDRVYFDFSKAVLAPGTMARAQAVTGTLAQKVRIGQHTDTSLRLVIELGAGTPRYSAFLLYNPFRFVVDIEQPASADAVVKTAAAVDASARAAVTPLPPPVAPAALSTPAPLPLATIPADAIPATATALPPLPDLKVSTDISSIIRGAKPITLGTPPPAASTSLGTYSLARQLGLGVSRIVIDPGHGGHDPGAQANGIDEAELVLDVALRLEALLKQQGGVDVVLTRRTDEFIPLEERTAIANRAGADLFLSIHANAAADPLLHGIETYFLNYASNPAAETVAARENAMGVKTMGDLPELVKAITMNNKVAESREFAGMVQTSMTHELLTKNKTVHDLGVKQAPFVVLIGAQMPSVLAEISFVTNHAEATFLKQGAYRQGIAQALFDAVVRYQGSLKKPGAAATAKGGQ